MKDRLLANGFLIDECLEEKYVFALSIYPISHQLKAIS